MYVWLSLVYFDHVKHNSQSFCRTGTLMLANIIQLPMLLIQLGLKLRHGLFIALQEMEFILIQPTSMTNIHSRLQKAFKMDTMYHQLLVIHQIWEQLM